MKYYSTRGQSGSFSFEEAIYLGPAPDGGLFMPEFIPLLDSEFIETLPQKSRAEIGFKILRPYVAMPDYDLNTIVQDAFNFDSPLHCISPDLQFLELFHGPTLAFKDFGARFMARTMAYYKPVGAEINILVATSGDTGGAVASAFSGLDGFNVFILFPKGKVSPLQQKQLTTWEDNIRAIEVNGSFDDCQRLVKKAFGDRELRKNKIFGSANSINIARLLPQMLYYFEAFKQAKDKKELTVIVPSGNFGNLTAGLFAKKMGLPIHRFVAATNLNDIVPHYLVSSEYSPKVSRETLSNAMDVGDPSNFVRMTDLYKGIDEGSTWNNLTQVIKQHVVNDEDTLKNIRVVWDQTGYLMDPHTAVAYDAAKTYPGNNIIVSTAHWSKFLETIKKAIGQELPPIPDVLTSLMIKKERYNSIEPEYQQFLDIIKD